MRGGAAAVVEAERLLKGWIPVAQIARKPRGRDDGVDFVARLPGGARLAVQVKGTGDVGAVTHAALQMLALRNEGKSQAIPVLAASYMPPAARAACERSGLSWFDLSGNAHIVGPNLLIQVEGKPNRFVRPGRPASAFAPNSARIARRLLIEPRRSWKQQELAAVSDVDPGLTSRVLRRLEERGLVARDADRRIGVRNHDLLLDAFAEAYDFQKHSLLAGHLSVRSGDEAVAQLHSLLAGQGIRHAATGLAAAWLMTSFAGFRLATFFCEIWPPPDALASVGFRKIDTGANVWLVVPADAGVFDGGADEGGIPCVHPVQAYLDLKAQPERGAEAAEELRRRRLKASWG